MKHIDDIVREARAIPPAEARATGSADRAARHALPAARRTRATGEDRVSGYLTMTQAAPILGRSRMTERAVSALERIAVALAQRCGSEQVMG